MAPRPFERAMRYTEHEILNDDGSTSRRRMRWQRVYIAPHVGWACIALEELRNGYWQRIE